MVGDVCCAHDPSIYYLKNVETQVSNRSFSTWYLEVDIDYNFYKENSPSASPNLVQIQTSSVTKTANNSTLLEDLFAFCKSSNTMLPFLKVT